MRLYSVVQLEKSVTVDLSGAIFSLLVVNQLCSVLRQGCRVCVAVFTSLVCACYCDVICI